MSTLKDLKVKLFADGADKAGMLQLNANPLIKGMTTNPSLMRKAGIHDYEAFARDILQHITEKPVSLEVFSRDAAAGAQDQRLGQKRLHENPHHQHARRIVAAAHPRTGPRRGETQRHRHPHRGAGRGCRPGAESQSAGGRVRVRRAHCGHRG